LCTVLVMLLSCCW